MSPKLFVDEIEIIVKKYGIKIFNFIDCSFEDPGTNYERMASIANEIKARELDIQYFVFVRAEFHRNASDELMKLLVSSGLSSVMIGVETGNEFDQK